MLGRLLAWSVAASFAVNAGCTIDPVARAKLKGSASGDAIFQQSGTSDQVSFKVTLTGPDGTYDVRVGAGMCDAPAPGGYALGTLVIAQGNGELRGVTDEREVATDSELDVIGDNVIAEQLTQVASCGLIFNSD